MDVSNLPIMAALKKRMHWLNSNQTVLSENIANADTPGYTAKELEKQSFSNLVENLSGERQKTAATQTMLTNNPRHINTAGSAAGAAAVKDDESGEESANGNSVILEDQMIKLADNQMKYGMVVNLYKKNMGLIKIALGKGGGR
jgi:flagellar basal-body rod protein FlgB